MNQTPDAVPLQGNKIKKVLKTLDKYNIVCYNIDTVKRDNKQTALHNTT